MVRTPRQPETFQGSATLEQIGANAVAFLRAPGANGLHVRHEGSFARTMTTNGLVRKDHLRGLSPVTPTFFRTIQRVISSPHEAVRLAVLRVVRLVRSDTDGHGHR